MASTSTAAQVNTPAQILQWLADQRMRPTRQSARTVEYGQRLLETGYIKRLGDDVLWSALEQIALAALDVGDWELVELCLARLDTRFPKSSRVAVLRGMLFEARGELTRALHYYEELMAKTEGADMMLSKRLVATLKALEGVDPRYGISAAIKVLHQHLDVYYTDPEGWQELASMYLDQGQLPAALSALEELMLLMPQNGFYVLQYAETLYTAGEYATAYKSYLRVLDMGATVEKPSSKVRGEDREGERSDKGPELRALWGLKATMTKLREASTPGALSKKQQQQQEADGIKAESLDDVEQLVTDLILNRAYASGGAKKADVASLAAARRVLSS